VETLFPRDAIYLGRRESCAKLRPDDAQTEAEIVEFAQSSLDSDPSLRAADLVLVFSDRFVVSVHSRSIERAFARRRSPKSGSH